MSKAEELSQNRYSTLAEKYAFIDGYEQAEEDLALTLVDIRKICLIAKEVHKYYGFWSDIVYQEILNRFNKQKEK